MRIIDRISKRIDLEMARQMRALGFEVEAGLMTILVDEAHDAWPHVQRLVREWEMLDDIEMKFSKSELSGAAYLELGTTWHHSYPMPKDHFGYMDVTYDLRNYCENCAIGARQKAPFRMKAEPKWGSKQILQLNWVFDEYFVCPETWETVFKPFEIPCRPVVKHRTSAPLESVVQLDISDIAPFRLSLPGSHEYSECPDCGNRKYVPHRRGYFPRFQQPFAADLFRTQEYFGSGGSAWRATIVSGKLYSAMRDAQLKGATFHPLEPND